MSRATPTRTAPPAVALAACLLLVACSDDPEMSGTSAGGGPSASAAPTTPAASASAAPSEPAPAFEADAARDEQAAEGGPLGVTAVRVARQDGYDRVVFELGGAKPGRPGWRVGYEQDPRRDGSGDPVELGGDAALVVRIDGVGYPFDTGVEEAAKPSVPRDLEVVQDVVLGSVYEGVYEAFIGVSSEQPFRVFRLENPARVVVDVRHR